MSIVAFDLHPEASVKEKEEVKEEMGKGFATAVQNEEKKAQCDNDDSPSNTAQPSLAVVGKEDLETGGPIQSIGPGSRFQALPEDVEELFGSQVFPFEDDFEAALEKFKIADEPIVLGDDGGACLYMPGEEHNRATGYIVRRFLDWACRLKGCAGANTNVKLGPRVQRAPPPRKRHKPKKRLPDVSFWGRSKCKLKDNGDISEVLRVSPGIGQPDVHPHVVVQVSVFNDEDYEIDAMNNLATRATAGQGVPPNLGVLIKQRKITPGAPAGFDIYYLPAGTFMHDAVNGTNGARHVVYNHGGADVLVTITEQDLGGIQLTWRQSMWYFMHGGTRDFELSMAELYAEMF